MAKSKATATNARANKIGRRSASGNNDDDNDDVKAAAVVAAAVAPAPAKHNSKKKRKVNRENDNESNNGGSIGAAEAAAAEPEALVDRAAAQPPHDRAAETEHGGDQVRSRGGGGGEKATSDDAAPYCTIKLPMRPNLFPVPETWWMVDLHAHPTPTQGATPLVRRCMRELGWNETKARTVLQAYRQFLTVKVVKKDWNAQLLSPSVAVDQMWHQHLLDNANYSHDFLLLCDGHYVRHDPDGGLDTEGRKNRLEATRQALLDSFGGDDGAGGGGVDASATGPWKEVFEGAAEPPPEAPQPSEVASTARSLGLTAAAQASDGNGAYIDIVLTTLTGGSTHLRVMPTARMGAVFAEYGRRTGVDPNICRFFVRERNLDAEDTPIALGLQNGDRVYVHIRVRGC